jgi:hypothetical protein
MHNYEAAVKLLDQYCKAPSVLELKVGCQVMLITNVKGGEGGLFNGSLYVVRTLWWSPADSRPQRQDYRVSEGDR